MRAYFSDFVEVHPDDLQQYGAFNISLLNDMPLFVDPFLLFNSKKKEYQMLHRQIIEYVIFIKNMAENGELDEGMKESLLYFPEVKQNWFGYCLLGNAGSGLGKDFANALHRNLLTSLRNFGKENITGGSHLEKLCLIKDGVGRDNISDFTTNLIKEYLLNYTQKFAIEHIKSQFRRNCVVPKVRFNYATCTWESAEYELPVYDGDYIILTPRGILTKDDTWINRHDIIGDFSNILSSIPNIQLRSQLNYYFKSLLPKEPKQKDKQRAVGEVLIKYPEFIDYYIRYKETIGDQAKSISYNKVKDAESLYIYQVSLLMEKLDRLTDFYSDIGDTHDEALRRLEFLKDVIENKGGHKIFYIKGKPIRRESDLQIMYRLTWFASHSDISREVNDGRGPVDFKASRGRYDKTLIEFKLASNSKLKSNLEKQLKIYEKASNPTKPSIKAILFFTNEEYLKVRKILKELKLEKDDNIVLIDAGNSNKPSASVA